MKRFSGSGTSNGRRISEFNTLKTTAFAPIPNASVKTAAIVNPGDLRSIRRLKRISLKMSFNFSSSDRRRLFPQIPRSGLRAYFGCSSATTRYFIKQVLGHHASTQEAAFISNVLESQPLAGLRD